MPPLRVTFTLGDRDLRYLRNVVKKAAEAADSISEANLVKAARALAEHAREQRAPDYVLSRLETLELLADMIQDTHWALPAPSRRKIMAVLAYFSDPDDLIPDDVPGLGFLDDAVMVELACRNLRPELEAYRDFCRFRHQELDRRRHSGEEEGAVSRLDWLEARRKGLQDRMHRHRGLFSRSKD